MVRMPDSEVHPHGAIMLSRSMAKARMDRTRCCFMISGIGFFGMSETPQLRERRKVYCWNRLCDSLIPKRTVGRSFQLFFWNRLNEALALEEIHYKYLNSKTPGSLSAGLWRICRCVHPSSCLRVRIDSSIVHRPGRLSVPKVHLRKR